jgi:CheY-like chemotaxis protein
MGIAQVFLRNSGCLRSRRVVLLLVKEKERMAVLFLACYGKERMKTILVIDDNEIVLRLICDLLSRSGFEVLTAHDGKNGMKTYYSNSPSLVITDIVMPEKDGLEVIMELSKQEPKPKIIALSGGGRLGPDTYLHLAEHLGANRIIEKPIRPAELIEVVKELLVQSG